MNMLKNYILLLSFIFVPMISFSQDIMMSGFVTDATSGEKLIGAAVVVVDSANVPSKMLSMGTATDINGYFQLTVNVGVNIMVSHLGYEKHFMKVEGTKNKSVNIKLLPLSTSLQEVEISAQTTDISRPKFNTVSISPKDMYKLPSLGGKPDVLKVAHLQPGIEGQNEATSILVVRGGNPGENLYLLDNVPLVYVNHIGGFMSVFNPEMINGMSIYKGGFPSKYGGRLSSIVEITQKQGDKSHLKGSLSVGITELSFSVEGPTKLKNSSFIVTGRKTLCDLYFLGISFVTQQLESQEYSVFYGFHDINGKFSWQPDDKNSFSINVYEGDDYLKYWSDIEDENVHQKHSFTDIWGNILTSATWNRVVSPKVYATNTISYTRYRLNSPSKYSLVSGNDTTVYNKIYGSSVNDVSARSLWKYSVNRLWQIEYGLNASWLRYVPNDYYRKSNIQTVAINEIVNAGEASVFIDNNIHLWNFIDGVIGIRISDFYSNGYNNLTFEPRVNLNFNVIKDNVFNISYMRVSQNTHLLFTQGSITNNEVWVPAGEYAPSSYSDQLSIGWKGDFANGMFSAEIDAYYKKLYNLSTYKEGYVNLEGDSDWRSKIETGGEGTSKGFEFMFKKNEGKFTGFVGYTLSKTKRVYENINNGVEYNYEFDRPHSLSVNLNYVFNKKWSVSATWNYSTGLPYTPAIGKYYVQRFDNETNRTYYDEVMVYGERNSARMRDYHRLDIGAVYSKLTKRGRKAEWTFSIYNVYNRHNPYSYYYSTDELERYGDMPRATYLRLFQVSFFPILPTASYKVYF